MNKTIYMDNAATTPVNADVLKEMYPMFRDNFGNPSTIYNVGKKAKEKLENARNQVAKALGADAKEIFFTSCGTESDNWAIKGAALEGLKKGKNHIITSKIEHHAVLHTAQFLEKNGFNVTYLDVDRYGLVSPEDVKNAITDKTALVSIMFANNEIGTVQPIEEIGKICKEKGVLFHTDAVQAVGHIPIDVKKQNIDMLSLSAHKFNGPKGTGALFIRKGVRIVTFMEGGAQESRKRAGTENTAGIVGMGKAIEIACDDIENKVKALSEKRDKLINELLKITHSRLNGHPTKRLPGNVNISFEGIEGESLLLFLNMAGICASSGSACTSGSLDPSHVLLAIGLPHEIAHGSLRLSLSEENTYEEIEFVIGEVNKIVNRLRSMSPLWEKIIKNEK
ncbi:MAG: cysteine desulfurase NifS [Clostridia bacterium]|nr:cysteine desulfurase NifS [Clostridia bacterium]